MECSLQFAGMKKPLRRALVRAALVLLLFTLLAGACVVVGPRGKGDATCANIRPVAQREAFGRARPGPLENWTRPVCHGFFHFEGDDEDDCFILYPPIDTTHPWSVASSPGRGELALRYYKGFDVWTASDGGVLVRLDRRWCAFPLTVQRSLSIAQLPAP